MNIQFLLKNTGMYERLGIMTLSSVLKKHGHEVDLTLTEELSEEEIVQKVKKFKPSVLAYSIMTGEHIYHIDLNQMIRNHYDALSVFGGPHPTYSPEMIDKKNLNVEIEIDGGINFENCTLAKKAGANVLVSGSTIFKENQGNLRKNIETLRTN